MDSRVESGWWHAADSGGKGREAGHENVEYTWNMKAIPMKCAWSMHEYVRSMCGICMSFAWDTDEYAWSMCRICPQHVWRFHGIRMTDAWNMHGL